MTTLSTRMIRLFMTLILVLASSLLSSTKILQAASLTSHSLEIAMPTEHDFIIPTYQFLNGQQLKDLKIHYATLGTPHKNEKGQISNAVLILHWTGADGAAMLSEDFKAHLYAPGKPLDANKYFLIFPDSIGHGKSSKPSDGLKSDFPLYGYRDMVDLQHKLIVDGLGISHLKMILGTSMGGMHTWLWSELYPNFMDGVMPIVSLPTKITGRNLIWRQAIVEAIKTDPEWKGGKYTQQPFSLLSTWPFARMLLDGVPHLEKTVNDRSAAHKFIQEAMKEAAKKDANDLIYVLEASRDYDPEPNLEAIQTKVFALDFTDDQLDPVQLHVLKDLIKRVKQGRAVIQPGTAESYGHLTMAHPDLWAHQVVEFLSFLNEK